jgi:hypothetical protein
MQSIVDFIYGKESSAEMVQRTWNTIKNSETVDDVLPLERFADTFYEHMFEKNPGFSTFSKPQNTQKPSSRTSLPSEFKEEN